MAAIEKIYGKQSEWKQLVKWLIFNQPSFLKYMNIMPESPDTASALSTFPISLFPREADEFLLIKCPMEFLKQQIRENYDNCLFVSPKKVFPEWSPTPEEFKNFTLHQLEEFGEKELAYNHRPQRDKDYIQSVWEELKSK